MDPFRKAKVDGVFSKWEKRGNSGRNRKWGRRAKNDFHTSSASQQSTHTRDNLGNGHLMKNHYQLPENRPARYRRRLEQQEQTVEEEPPVFLPSLELDLREAHSLLVDKTLSLSRCCPTCVPASKSRLETSNVTASGLLDILRVDRSLVRGFLGYMAPYVTWVLRLKFTYTIPPVGKQTLQSARVQEAIKQCAEADTAQNFPAGERMPLSLEKAMKKQTARAEAIMNKMAIPKIHRWMFRVGDWILFHIFGRMYKHVYVQRSHVAMLREAQQRGFPLIFLPSHKSHIDYIIVSFVLFNLEIKVPHIAAGDNLNIPVFRKLVKWFCGWFIRRRLDSDSGCKDILYRKCLQEYVIQLLKANQNIEFYIEGSRSRSGKPALPKTGLLSLLVDALKDGVIPDVLIVPLNVSYDKVLERKFIRHELMGGNKKPESFLQGVKGVWSMLTSNVGSVRVDFSQPFSLQEYLNSAHISQYSLMDYTLTASPLPSPDLSPSHDLTVRRNIVALSHHVVYEIARCGTIMSTNIVAFLLLTKHRKGVKFPELVSSYEWIVDTISSRGRSVGFDGTSSEAVCYALVYMSRLVTKETTALTNGMSLASCQVIHPRQRLPDVLELMHHVNQVSPVFFVDAIIACSIAVLCHDLHGDGQIANKTEIGDKRQFRLSQMELIEEATYLTKLFSRELIFAAPCQYLSSVFQDAIDRLVHVEILSVVEPQYTSCSYPSGKRMMTWCNDDDDYDSEAEQPETMFEVSNTRDADEHLKFLQSILGPYVEGYWWLAVQLATFENEELPNEANFLKGLQSDLVNKAGKGVLFCPESCSMDILRNACQSLKTSGVLGSTDTGNLVVHNMLGLLDMVDHLTACKL